MKQFLFLLTLVGLMIACGEEETRPTTIKLDYFEETMEIPGLGFQPQYRTQYDYNAQGNVNRYTFLSYDPNTKLMSEQRHFRFTYVENRLDKIEGYEVNATTPYITYTYHYEAGSRIAKIKETNASAGINSEATFSYPSVNVIKVSYQYSNGGFFEYEITTDGNNVLRDKTTRGAQLCSNGEYTYDQKLNPFKTLGYLDYLMVNLSNNNKLTEDVDYVGCAFPSFIPESFAYMYNNDGYPTEVTTTYKSTNENAPKSKRKFFYKRVEVPTL